MKTIRVTYSKPGAKAVCVMRYRETSRPFSVEWTGDRRAFEVAPGVPVDPSFHLAKLEYVTDYQARLCGATFTIEDLGGQAMDLRYEALPPYPGT